MRICADDKAGSRPYDTGRKQDEIEGRWRARRRCKRMKTFRMVLWGLVAVLAVVVGWTAFEATGGKATGPTPGEPYGVPFSLVDQNGQPITEAAFRGKPSTLFFGFTHCPDVCPTTLFELNGWLKTVDPDGSKLKAYFVTVDPERDTPEIMKSYVSAVSDRIVGITGEPDKIAAMLKGFNIYAKKVPSDPAKPDGDYTMDHTASVFLLDKEGAFRGTIAYGENPDTAVQKLKNLAAR